MPGLIRGVARTAVIAGTATAVSNRVSRRQANRWADQEQAEYDEQEQEPEPAPAGPDKYEELTKLNELKTSGILTEEEFESEKAKILAG
jgi:hypothetical protein